MRLSPIGQERFRIRAFIGLPIGGKKLIFRMKVQRYKCKNKDYDFARQ